MADLSGFPMSFDGDTSNVDESDLNTVGKLAYGPEGKVFIYLKGVASTVVGDCVTYDEAYLTTRVSANGVGPVAVAMAAVVASRWGWYQIFGTNTSVGAISGGGAAADVALYLTSTAGLLDDVDVAGDLVKGILSRSAESSALLTAQLNYPFVDNVADD